MVEKVTRLSTGETTDKSLTLEASDRIHPDDSDRSILLVAKGGSIVLVGSVFAYASQFVMGIFLTRLLGAQQYGNYKVAVIAGEMAASFALLGLDYAMVRFVALFASRRDTAGLWGTLQIGIGLTTISSLLIAAALFALANPIAVNVFHEAQLAPLLRLASLIVPFSTLAGVLAPATRGHNKMQYDVSAKQIAQPLTRLILLIPLALLGFTAAKALVGYIGGLVVTCALLLFFLNRLFPLRRPLQTARRDTKEVLVFSLPAYFSTMIGTFGPSLQTVLLGSLNTMATVGIFAVANQVSTASTLFNGSIGMASSPVISELHGKGGGEQLTRFYKATAKWTFAVNLPMFLIVLLLAEPILTIFGKEFVTGSATLIILALANLVTAAGGLSNGVLAMTGHTPAKLVNSAIQAGLSIGLCILLIPRWGAFGAGLAVLIASIVMHLLPVLEVFAYFRMLPYTTGFLKPVAAGLVAVVVGWLVRQAWHADAHLVLAAVDALVILAAYLGMLLALGLSPEDRTVFAQVRLRIANLRSRRR